MRTSILSCARGIVLGALAAFLFAAILFLSGVANADAPVAQAPANPQADQAARLVRQALEAEAAEKPADRDALLKQALAIAPDFAPAHWQEGEIRSSDAWTSIDAAAKPSVRSAKLEEYRQLRDQAGATVDEQLNLARWCEKAGLNEQQRAHLMFALELQPNNKEAITKLGLVRYRGELVPATQLDDIKAQVRQSFAESKEWKAQAAQWQQQLREKPKSLGDVVKQIRAIRDPAAIPALEKELAKSGPEVGKVVIECLAAMPQQTATESLVRHALFSPYDDVAHAAAYALRSRSPYSYVPILLSALTSPIRVEMDVLSSDPRNFRYVTVLRQDGISENYIAPASLGNGVLWAQEPFVNESKRHGTYSTGMGGFPLDVGASNEHAVQMNMILANVLETTTDQHLGTNPSDWWSWWYAQNEYYEPPQMPDVTPVRHVSISCFPAGTAVWTMSGPMQIEKIKVGELVLAQDSETGELAYKPVVGTTIRPASPLIETHLGETVIRSTRGHPFWVSGIGCQMAKELKAGEWLHAAHGPVQIDSAEPSDEAVCYNLVVADFHDYFVSDAKVLVHDNLLRGPTLATVPGLAEAK